MSATAARDTDRITLFALQRPRWPRQVQWYLSRVTVAGIFALKYCQWKHSFSLNGLLLIDISYSDTMTILKMTLLITLNTGDITYNDIS